MSRRRRRIACDCGIVAVTGSDPAGMTVGRRTRSKPPAIWRALMLREIALLAAR